MDVCFSTSPVGKRKHSFACSRQGRTSISGRTFNGLWSRPWSSRQQRQNSHRLCKVSSFSLFFFHQTKYHQPGCDAVLFKTLQGSWPPWAGRSTGGGSVWADWPTGVLLVREKTGSVVNTKSSWSERKFVHRYKDWLVGLDNTWVLNYVKKYLFINQNKWLSLRSSAKLLCFISCHCKCCSSECLPGVILFCIFFLSFFL